MIINTKPLELSSLILELIRLFGRFALSILRRPSWLQRGGCGIGAKNC